MERSVSHAASGTEWNLVPFGNSKPFGKWLSRRDSVKIARQLTAGVEFRH